MTTFKILRSLVTGVLLLVGHVLAEEEGVAMEPSPSVDFGTFEEIAASAPKGKVSGDISEWISGISYAELVLYDNTVEPGGPLIKEGKFHGGIKKEWSKRLSKEELAQLTESAYGRASMKGRIVVL